MFIDPSNADHFLLPIYSFCHVFSIPTSITRRDQGANEITVSIQSRFRMWLLI